MDGEGLQLTAGPCLEPREPRVVGIQHRELVAALVRKDRGLRIRVGFERRIAIEVVGGEIQDRRRVWTKGLDSLQLKARELHHQRVVLPVHGVRQRRPEIAADEDTATAGRQHRTQQGGGRALAVGPGDRRDRCREKPRRQLDLRHDATARRAGSLQIGMIPGHTRRDDDQLDVTQREARLAESRFDALRHLHLDRLLVEEQHLGTARPQQGRGRQSRFAGPHHRAANPLKIRLGHRSLSVASEVSESRIETIQARTMIFGSAQPLSSKW